MTLNNTAIATAAGNGIGAIGTRAYLVKTGAGSPDDPFSRPTPDTIQPMTLVYSNWTQQEIDGSLIKRGDRKAVVSVPSLNGVMPEVGDRFRETASGKDFQIVPPLTTLAPAGQPLLYTLNIRG